MTRHRQPKGQRCMRRASIDKHEQGKHCRFCQAVRWALSLLWDEDKSTAIHSLFSLNPFHRLDVKSKNRNSWHTRGNDLWRPLSFATGSFDGVRSGILTIRPQCGQIVSTLTGIHILLQLVHSGTALSASWCIHGLNLKSPVRLNLYRRKSSSIRKPIQARACSGNIAAVRRRARE